MKKFLSMLLAIAMMSSVAVTASAATAADAATIDATFSATKVNVGEEFTITITSEGKSTYMEDMKLYFGDISFLESDYQAKAFEVKATGETTANTAFELISIADGEGYTEDQMFQLYISGSGSRAKYTSLDFYNKDAFLLWSYGGANVITYPGPDTVATVTLKALKAGEYTFRVDEASDNTNKTDDNGYNGIVKKEVVTVVDPNASTEPETTVAIAGPATVIKNASNDPSGRRWTVTADAEDINANKVTAEIVNKTKNEEDEKGKKTLSFSDSVKDDNFGDGDVTFDLFMFIKNAAYYGDTFELTVSNGTTSVTK